MLQLDSLGLERQAITTLQWVVNVFITADVPFQINGGLAAKVYGSQRPLFDLDFDVPEACFAKLLPALQPYLIYGPERFQDETWDLELMTARYHDTLIDIGGAYQTRCFDKTQSQWVSCAVDLSQVYWVSVYGLQLPIVSKASLIAYKRKTARAVDLEDLAQITR